jgi:hypothetical protein
VFPRSIIFKELKKLFPSGGKLTGMKDNGFNISYDWLLEIIASQPTIKSIPLKGKKNQITKNRSFEAERT